jgi:hypothetical protein
MTKLGQFFYVSEFQILVSMFRELYIAMYNEQRQGRLILEYLIFLEVCSGHVHGGISLHVDGVFTNLYRPLFALGRLVPSWSADGRTIWLLESEGGMMESLSLNIASLLTRSYTSASRATLLLVDWDLGFFNAARYLLLPAVSIHLGTSFRINQ